MGSLEDGAPVPPQDALLFLLGGMNTKIDGVMTEQAAQRTEQTNFRNEMRTDITVLRDDLGSTKSRVDVLAAAVRPKTPWYSVVAGITGIVVGLGSLITLIAVLNGIQ